MTSLEIILITSRKAQMIAYLNVHPRDFTEAIKLAISNRQPFSWRAAWLLWSCMKENDERVFGYIDDIVRSLPGKKIGHQRELIKILLLLELEEKYQGLLFDLCLSIWQKLENKPSARFTAFKMILKIGEKHPDLKDEINFLVGNEYMNSLSAAVRKSVLKMLEKLNRA